MNYYNKSVANYQYIRSTVKELMTDLMSSCMLDLNLLCRTRHNEQYINDPLVAVVTYIVYPINVPWVIS